MMCVTKNYVCDISAFHDSINRKWVEDNTKTNLIYSVAKFENLHNMSFIIHHAESFDWF